MTPEERGWRANEGRESANTKREMEMSGEERGWSNVRWVLVLGIGVESVWWG